MDHKNPWTILSNRKIYSNPWIDVEEKDVLTPNQTKGIYGTVHFKNYAVGILPLDHNMNTWLVGQYRFPLEEYSWEIPMGGGKLDEPILVSAQRELKEETGIIANKWEMLLKIHTSNSVTDETGFVYLAKDLTFGDSQPEDTEDLKVKKLPFKEVYQMALEGKITDAISLAAILKTGILL